MMMMLPAAAAVVAVVVVVAMSVTAGVVAVDLLEALRQLLEDGLPDCGLDLVKVGPHRMRVNGVEANESLDGLGPHLLVRVTEEVEGVAEDGLAVLGVQGGLEG